MDDTFQTMKGRLRLYWLTAVVCMGGVLFGYDSGVVGGVLTFKSFSNHFEYTSEQETSVSSIAVGIQQAGALVGCLVVWPLTKRWGRRWTILGCSIVFTIGVIMETVPSHKLPVFYVGRVVCGLGMGASSTIVPIFLSEMAPKNIRGKLGSCYQLMYTVGVMASYWIDYGVRFMDPSDSQWQIPISLQMVPAFCMGAGMLTLKESVRWLVAADRHEEAWESLVWIRGADSEEVATEFEEIQDGVLLDKHAAEGLTLQELLEWPNMRRFLTAFSVFMCQQSVGSTALAIYAPQFYSMLVGSGQQNLLLSGIFGAIKVVACLTFVLFISERFGRKNLLLGGSAAQCACMVTIAAVVKTHPPPKEAHITPSGIGTVALLYLNIIIYNASWGPLPWPITSELFSARIREPGVAVGVAGQWLFNFVYSFSTPYMMDSWGGWGTFLFYGICDVFCGLFVFFFIKETRNKTLEEINAMYDPQNKSSEPIRKHNAGSSTEHVERVEG